MMTALNNSAQNAGHRVGVLIDGNNLNRGVKSDSQQVNYDTLIERVLHGRTLKKLFYFQEGEINSTFAFALHQKFHGIVRSCKKSADVPLTVQAIQLAPHVDTLILGSGDVDYRDLVSYLRSMGVTVEILSFRNSLSYELENYADFVHFIKDIDLMKKSSGSSTSPEKQKSQQPAKPSKSAGKKSGKSASIISKAISFAETVEPVVVSEQAEPQQQADSDVNKETKARKKRRQSSRKKQNDKGSSNLVPQESGQVSDQMDS